MDPEQTPELDSNTINYYMQVLGFANLIQQEILKREDQLPTNIHMVISKPQPPKRHIDESQIRCICGKDKFYSSRPMIQCSYCSNYLHKDCAMTICPDRGNFLCPFCRVYQKKVDPFTQMGYYFSSVETELDVIRYILSKAKEIESEYFESKDSDDPNVKKKFRKYQKSLEIANAHFQQLCEIPINIDRRPKKRGNQ